jgi:hypothetical protein
MSNPKSHFKIQYHGSLFWLVFWLIIFLPIGLILLFTDSTFQIGDKRYHYKYLGDRFWLCFWVLIFFPVAILLFFLNGFSYKKETILSPTPEIIDKPIDKS